MSPLCSLGTATTERQDENENNMHSENSYMHAMVSLARQCFLINTYGKEFSVDQILIFDTHVLGMCSLATNKTVFYYI
jgi:hypothetical protein